MKQLHTELPFLVLRGLVSILIAAAAALYFVPFYPNFPVDQLDPSWQLGINQAMAQGLRFGTDIIFTFGPYASIYTHQFLPGAVCLMYAGSALIAVAFFVAIHLLASRRSMLWLLLVIPILGVSTRLDPVFYGLPLMLVCIAGDLRARVANGECIERDRIAMFGLLILSAALALPLFIKGSFVIPTIAGYVAASLLLMRSATKLACAIFAVFVLSTLIAWLSAGQKLEDLPGYFLALAPIISGYTDAMSRSGPAFHILAFAISATVLTAILLAAPQLRQDKKAKHILLITFVGVTFLIFKAAFVRHDSYHGPIAAQGLLLLGFIISLQSSARFGGLALLATVLAWGVIESSYTKNLAIAFRSRVEHVYVDQSHGLAKWIEQPDWVNSEYQHAMLRIREKAEFAVDGTADIYAYDQALLIANNVRWNPRPVLQSYSAYLPELAARNADHLRGMHAPDNIIFNLQTIDSRYPALDDSLSWIALVENYSPVRTVGHHLLLRKKSPGFGGTTTMDGDWRGGDEYHFDQEVEFLPDGSKGVWVELDIEPTFAGKLFSIVYKLPLLDLWVERKDGTVERFRVIASSARAGFLLSPNVVSTSEFARLFNEKSFASLDSRSVVKIKITGGFCASLFWRDKYMLRWKNFTSPAN